MAGARYDLCWSGNDSASGNWLNVALNGAVFGDCGGGAEGQVNIGGEYFVLYRYLWN